MRGGLNRKVRQRRLLRDDGPEISAVTQHSTTSAWEPALDFQCPADYLHNEGLPGGKGLIMDDFRNEEFRTPESISSQSSSSVRGVLAAGLSLVAAGTNWPRRANSASCPKGVVVLLHGLAANSWLMALLAYRLQLQGYHVINWGYWSFWQSLDHLVPHFKERFHALARELPPETPLQIVAHSMGAIITRAALESLDLPMLKRVVLLSPPNRGSHVATRLGPYLRWLSPLVEELADHSDSYVNRTKHHFRSGIQVGVIAAKWDYVLSEETTHLEEEVDHITLPSRHSGLVLRRRVADQILYFLEQGTFRHEAEADLAVSPASSPERLMPSN